MSVKIGISHPSTPLLVPFQPHHRVVAKFVFLKSFLSLHICDNSEPFSPDPEKRRSHSLAWYPGYCSFLHRLQRRCRQIIFFSPTSAGTNAGSEINCFVLSFSVSAKEEEKQKLMKWSSELKLEREQLEQRVKQLSNSITVRNTIGQLSNTEKIRGH